MTATATPAGWYADSEHPGGTRYWDGNAWTDQRNGPATPEAPVPTVPAPSSRQFADGETLIWEGQSQSMSAKATGGHGAAKYILTNRFMYFEKGLLSTNSQQFPVATLLDVDVHQSMTQKPRGVGDVTIKIQHGDKLDSLTLESIPDFRNVQRLMNETSHAARTAITQMQNTHHYGSGTPVQTTPTPAVAPAPVPVPSPTPAPAADPMEQLRKLAELRDAGILSTEEFDAKKQEILARM